MILIYKAIFIIDRPILYLRKEITITFVIEQQTSMKFSIDKKTFSWGLTAFFVIAASIILFYFVFHASNISTGFRTILHIAMPIIDGVILAYLLTPLVNGIEKNLLIPLLKKRKKELTDKTKKRMRMLSILFTIIIVFLLVYAFFAMVIPQIINSIQNIVLQFPAYIETLENFTTKLLANNPSIRGVVNGLLEKYSMKIPDWINNSLMPQINSIIKSLSLSVISFLKAVWNLILGLIISIYILGSKETFCGQAKKIAFAFFDRKTANSIISDFRFTHRTFSGFISGKILDSLIIGLICFSCISVMKMPYAVLISVIIGVTNVIPFFGPYLGAIPSALLILLIDPIKCLYFVIFILILQQFDGNFLGPKILGESTGLSGFWVIFSITIFGGLFGVFGMIIGVPTFAVFYAFVRKLTNRLLKKRGLPIITDRYMRLDMITSGNTFRELKPIDSTKKPKGSKFCLNKNLNRLDTEEEDTDYPENTNSDDDNTQQGEE